MRGEHSKPKNKFFASKLVLISTALTLVICSAIGGTIAWLVAKTEPVVNTFTYGDINITLEEKDTNKDGDNNPNTNNYPILPGNPIEKDPKVTFLANSENAWLFVKLEKTSNFDNFMTYDIAEGWTVLDGTVDVYYRIVDKADKDAEFYVVKDNTINVKEEVTKDMLNALDKNGANNYPKLTVTAYAVQRDDNIDAIDTAKKAWDLVQNS